MDPTTLEKVKERVDKGDAMNVSSYIRNVVLLSVSESHD